MTSQRHIAVVGSGIAGLTAAYILRTQDRVTLYEAADGSAVMPIPMRSTASPAIYCESTQASSSTTSARTPT